MARWNTLTDDELADRTVFAGAFWYVGPFEERVGDLDLEEEGRRAEMLDDMRVSPSGYVY